MVSLELGRVGKIKQAFFTHGTFITHGTDFLESNLAIYGESFNRAHTI